ncbi:MAG: pentapeptide repeat-containing protein [bacterium]|uniref:pentapeptide repeat-containing protein n=1 Tax=Microcystis sp. TaxID=1127 RepID=UPI003919846B
MAKSAFNRHTITRCNFKRCRFNRCNFKRCRFNRCRFYWCKAKRSDRINSHTTQNCQKSQRRSI